MSETVEILCLANSRKHSGRCVAGLRTDGGGWVRPIGKNGLNILMPHHYVLPDNTEAALLDLLRIPVGAAVPQPHHPEDRLITGASWELVSRPATGDIAVPLLRAHLDRGPDLLGNKKDRLPYRQFLQRPADASLALIYPRDLRWRIERVGEYSKRRTRAVFTLSEVEYDLPVTDPEWEHQLSHLLVGEHPFASTLEHVVDERDRALMTVSLSEPLGVDEATGDSGWCYKLIAAVIVIPRAWRGAR
jgi:hypothetical protein